MTQHTVLIVNGEPVNAALPLTVADLLQQLNLAGKPVIVELNKQAILPRNYASTDISAGASLEIATLAVGG